MNANRIIVYYVSAHGYGHGVRSCDILRVFNRLYPDVRVIVTTDLPTPFLQNRLEPGRVSFRPGAFDVGMVQRDAILIDVPATLARLDDLGSRWNSMVESETRFLQEQKAVLIVSDIPAIPIEAAKAVGIPALATSNFSWDWIYSPHAARDARWQKFVDIFRKAYSKTDLLLRQPFHGDMSVFPRIEDLPVLASPGRNRRAELARLTGCSPDKTWVLISFYALNWDAAALDRAETLTDYEFFTVKPLEWRRKNIHPIDREIVPFSDVLASCDVVICKPGFGIVSECVVNDKPMIYSDRADFIEYDVLVEAIGKYLRNIHLPSAKLYRGDLIEALQAIPSLPPPRQTIPSGGAEVAARRIGSFLK